MKLLVTSSSASFDSKCHPATIESTFSPAERSGELEVLDARVVGVEWSAIEEEAGKLAKTANGAAFSADPSDICAHPDLHTEEDGGSVKSTMPVALYPAPTRTALALRGGVDLASLCVIV